MWGLQSETRVIMGDALLRAFAAEFARSNEYKYGEDDDTVKWLLTMDDGGDPAGGFRWVADENAGTALYRHDMLGHQEGIRSVTVLKGGCYSTSVHANHGVRSVGGPAHPPEGQYGYARQWRGKTVGAAAIQKAWRGAQGRRIALERRYAPGGPGFAKAKAHFEHARKM
uniref:Uncharacterized protein n=1 Tax=Marseillevirus LCMAC103 TaxID=2506604 RepID=A0A481YWU9_9VIRU|nr:MAG: hypothetical protein LCMAC103_03880 [Marseillevirus LCMAC103]